MPSAFPLLRPPVLAMAGEQEGSLNNFLGNFPGGFMF